MTTAEDGNKTHKLIKNLYTNELVWTLYYTVLEASNSYHNPRQVSPASWFILIPYACTKSFFKTFSKKNIVFSKALFVFPLRVKLVSFKVCWLNWFWTRYNWIFLICTLLLVFVQSFQLVWGVCTKTREENTKSLCGWGAFYALHLCFQEQSHILFVAS